VNSQAMLLSGYTRLFLHKVIVVLYQYASLSLFTFLHISQPKLLHNVGASALKSWYVHHSSSYEHSYVHGSAMFEIMFCSH